MKYSIMKKIIIQTIKNCMQNKLHYKDYIKILRENKKFTPIRNNKYYKDGFSLQFQKNLKTTLIVPKKCGVYHIQIHLDKNYQLVKFMKIKIKKKYCFINQTNRYTRIVDAR